MEEAYDRVAKTTKIAKMKQKRYKSSDDKGEDSSEEAGNIERVTCESTIMGKMTMSEIIKLNEEQYEKCQRKDAKGR